MITAIIALCKHQITGGCQMWSFFFIDPQRFPSFDINRRGIPFICNSWCAWVFIDLTLSVSCAVIVPEKNVQDTLESNSDWLYASFIFVLFWCEAIPYLFPNKDIFPILVKVNPVAILAVFSCIFSNFADLF